MFVLSSVFVKQKANIPESISLPPWLLQKHQTNKKVTLGILEKERRLMGAQRWALKEETSRGKRSHHTGKQMGSSGTGLVANSHPNRTCKTWQDFAVKDYMAGQGAWGFSKLDFQP